MGGGIEDVSAAHGGSLSGDAVGPSADAAHSARLLSEHVQRSCLPEVLHEGGLSVSGRRLRPQSIYMAQGDCRADAMTVAMRAEVEEAVGTIDPSPTCLITNNVGEDRPAPLFTSVGEGDAVKSSDLSVKPWPCSSQEVMGEEVFDVFVTGVIRNLGLPSEVVSVLLYPSLVSLKTAKPQCITEHSKAVFRQIHGAETGAYHTTQGMRVALSTHVTALFTAGSDAEAADNVVG
ncbi:hypothetical protein FA13DRAFT_1709937 [Coprinellus micaceus]|uniref:Uncharacterized protein n=1 Tax=Coprinellus micaceus TaxID=71717 RepID=A0A4Y7TAR8_COPMI|nr:hypothetical protein FA13DRAFT_1709937 [Coprinellus micaceus]